LSDQAILQLLNWNRTTLRKYNRNQIISFVLDLILIILAFSYIVEAGPHILGPQPISPNTQSFSLLIGHGLLFPFFLIKFINYFMMYFLFRDYYLQNFSKLEEKYKSLKPIRLMVFVFTIIKDLMLIILISLFYIVSSIDDLTPIRNVFATISFYAFFVFLLIANVLIIVGFIVLGNSLIMQKIDRIQDLPFIRLFPISYVIRVIGSMGTSFILLSIFISGNLMFMGHINPSQGVILLQTAGMFILPPNFLILESILLGVFSSLYILGTILLIFGTRKSRILYKY